MRQPTLGLIAAAVMVIGTAGAALTQDGKLARYSLGEKRSGYTFATAETQAIQDDDFANPAMLWAEKGADLWTRTDGAAGKSCASCHGQAETSMKGVAAKYPAIDEASGKLMAIQARVNQCRTQRMKAKPWKWESDQMLSMATFVGLQSRGMPVNVQTTGAYKPFFDKGKKFYYRRRGLLDMSCANCHEDNTGKMIRANRLSQGQGTGFPTYRLKWQKVGSLHRRFTGCNKQVRAQPYKRGSEEYTALELYVKWRGQGLLVEAPAVRM